MAFTIESMASHFETRQWVPYPVELVFAFFANPSNLPHLMPPVLETRVEDVRIVPPPPRPVAQEPARRFLSVAAGAGSEILISFYPFRYLPKRVSWLVRITEFEWNRHFCDEQVRGQFSFFRHRHLIRAETQEGQEGTLVTDAIEYELPFGPMRYFGGPLAQRYLERSFAYRHERLPEILATARHQAARRG